MDIGAGVTFQSEGFDIAGKHIVEYLTAGMHEKHSSLTDTVEGVPCNHRIRIVSINTVYDLDHAGTVFPVLTAVRLPVLSSVDPYPEKTVLAEDVVRDDTGAVAAGYINCAVEPSRCIVDPGSGQGETGDSAYL